MFLKRLRLSNFRNYCELDFEFKTPLTILLGNNAQGKSNFLESIYFLATTKSPKADKDDELIKKGESITRVEGTVECEQEETNLEIVMQDEEEMGFRKKVKVNGVPRRSVDYIGNLSVVSFSPEDINLVTGSPSLRRWHIDLTLAQIDKEYKSALTNYEEIVTRKNKVLRMIKEGLAKLDELDFWSERQFEFGRVVSEKRADFFSYLNATERRFGDFQFEYIQNVLTKERLEEYKGREVGAGASLIGPHRDDFLFVLSERDLSKFGSRGEHRTAVLDLKISESSFFEEKTGRRPILLLDDVFSELDNEHKKHVVELTKLQQTVVAGVELDKETAKSLKDFNLLFVENGKLSEKAGTSPKPRKE